MSSSDSQASFKKGGEVGLNSSGNKASSWWELVLSVGAWVGLEVELNSRGEDSC